MVHGVPADREEGFICSVEPGKKKPGKKTLTSRSK
jgi:hypothetical protein